MGLFNRNNINKINEKTYEENGYIIGIESHKIYHVPKIQENTTYILPDGTTELTESAISEIRISKPQKIIVPSSFKKFNYEFINFENLKEISLNEGVQEVKCIFGTSKNAVDFKLPTTIKKIARNNYPIVQNLNLPNGVIEIEPYFASHDTNLISVNLPGTIKTIPQGAFNQCKNLQTLTLNEGTETSGRDILRGTNNLRTLEIPSTYNGIIDLTMEGRPGSNIRGNSKYDGKRFSEEKNNILNIKIKRGSKIFEFNIKRGEMPTIEIRQNKILIKCTSQTHPISIDYDIMESGIYNIENGKIIKKQETTNNSHKQETIDKLKLLFDKAIKDNITDEDFELEGINTNEKNIVIDYMKEIFMKQGSIGIIRTDAIQFNRIFRDAIKRLEKEKTLLQENINTEKIKR